MSKLKNMKNVITNSPDVDETKVKSLQYHFSLEVKGVNNLTAWWKKKT